MRSTLLRGITEEQLIIRKTPSTLCFARPWDCVPSLDSIVLKEDFEYFEKSWLQKIEWVRSGDMRKGVLYCRRG